MVIEGVLWTGLNMLFGDPRSGKSILILQMIRAVTTGGKFLGRYQARQGRVLWLNLEDDLDVVQGRFAEMQMPRAVVAHLDTVFRFPTWSVGGEAALRSYLNKLECRLVVIDTAAGLGLIGGGSPQKSAFRNDYDSLRGLKHLAREFNVAILVLHHAAKVKNSNPILSVNGTTGLVAVTDSAMVIDVDKKGNRFLVIQDKRQSIRLGLRFHEEGLNLAKTEISAKPRWDGRSLSQR